MRNDSRVQRQNGEVLWTTLGKASSSCCVSISDGPSGIRQLEMEKENTELPGLFLVLHPT